MKQLTIQTSSHEYVVSIGQDLRFRTLEFLPKSYDHIFIITDSNVGPLYLEDVIDSLKNKTKVSYTVVPAGEGSKSSRFYFEIITNAIQSGLNRDSLIIALGGGMIGDLAGFVASTFMRGVDFVQMPTTILAHDSSVGGKVAINHPEGKNLIGSFYPPVAVIYDVETLHTIPFTEVRSGYAEIVKHSMIHEPPFWDQLKDTNLNVPLDDEGLKQDLLRGIEVKAAVVEKDEREQNIRQFLNFGHTLGHALEVELGYGEFTHGEAVALGMLFALQVSSKHYDIDLPYKEFYQWMIDNHYPVIIPDLSIDRLIERMKRDKKSKSEKITMILLKELGQPSIESFEEHRIKIWLEDFLRELN